MKTAAFVVCAVLAAAPARADLVTLDSTTIPLGTDVSHYFPGVTLQRLTQQSGTAATYAPTATPVITAGRYWGPSEVTFGTYSDLGDGYDPCYNGGTLSCLWFSYSVMEVTFDAPTRYVQIIGDWGSDGPGLRAYDSSGNLVSGCHNGGVTGSCTHEVSALTGPGAMHRSIMTIDRAQGDIARIVWGGLFGTGTAHRITYNVPEPDTWLLMVLGALPLLRRRRALLATRTTGTRSNDERQDLAR